MSNKSVIDKAIQQMQQKKADSREQRTGEYRIGLDAAINIVANLRDMHKDEIIKAVKYGFNREYFTPNFQDQKELFEQYYELTYGGKK